LIVHSNDGWNALLKVAAKIVLFVAACVVLCFSSVSAWREYIAENAFRTADTFSELMVPSHGVTSESALAKKRGDFYLLSAQPQNPEQAVLEYRRAVEANPNDSVHWVDLAGALEQLDQMQQADRAYRVADKLDPRNHFIQQAIGNFYLRQKQFKESGVHHARAMESYPSCARSIYVLYWSLGQSLTDVAGLLGSNSRTKQRYFLDALVSSSPQQVAPLWTLFSATPDLLNEECHRAYFSYLIKHKEFEQARVLWHLVASIFYGTQWDEASEPFWNRDFSRPLHFDGGLEWQQAPDPDGMKSTLADYLPSRNSRTVHLMFDGSRNLSWSGISHSFFVRPNQSYALHFRATVKNITTHNGPFVRVQLFSANPQYKQSEALTGTGDFEQSVLFTTPADCFLAEMRLCRQISTKLNNRIEGEAWFSDFELKEIESVPAPSAPAAK